MSDILEAGGVVVCLDGGTPLILLTTAKANPTQWIFPKGHQEEGETLEETAVREVWEETGITATPERRLGSFHFSHRGQAMRVEVYLLRYVGSGGSGEGRKIRWSAYEEALELLSFEEAKELLRTAWPVIELTAREERSHGDKTG